MAMAGFLTSPHLKKAEAPSSADALLALKRE